MQLQRVNHKNQFYITLIVSAMILFFHWLLMNNAKTDGIWEWLITSFFLFFVLPAVIIKFYFRETLSDFHLSFDFGWKEILITLITGSLFVGFFYFLVVKLSWYQKFPVADFFLENKNIIYLVDFLFFPVVVFSREFFFRGFLFKSTEKAIGYKWAILVQLLIVTVFQFKNGFIFDLNLLFLFLITNLFLGVLVFKTRSVFLTSIVSFLLGVIVDFSIFYNINIFINS